MKAHSLKIAPAILVAYCLILAFIPYPPILGNWESSQVFHTFAPEEIWINTIIHPRTNTGGYEYAPVDFSRKIASVFGFNLFSLRLGPIVYGLIALFLFYMVVRTWSNQSSSLLVTALFASNPFFIAFQHQLLIPIFALLCILLVIKTYLLAITGHKNNVVIFGISCAFACLFYVVVRYITLFLIVLWIFNIYKNEPSNREQFKKHLFRFSIPFLLTLFILNPVNLYRFFNITFLMPDIMQAFQYPNWNEFATRPSHLVSSLAVNLPLIFHSFLGGINDFYADYATELFVGIPHKLINLPTLLLLICGLIVVTLKHENRFLIISLFILTIFVPSLSRVYDNNNITLSPYRQFYGLIPIYFFISTGINYFYEKNKIMSSVVQGCCVLLIIFQTYQHIHEVKRVKNQIKNTNCSFRIMTLNESYLSFSNYVGQRRLNKTYNCELPKISKNLFESGKDPLNNYTTDPKKLIAYQRYAHDLSKEVQTINSKKPILLNVPASHLMHNKPTGALDGYNYVQVFLALYLAENDIDINYYVPYVRKLSFLESVLGWTITRFGTTQPGPFGGNRLSRHLTYPLNFNGEKYVSRRDPMETIFNLAKRFFPENILRKIIPPPVQYIAIKNTGNASNIYLVTSEFERKFFKEKFTDFIEVQL